MSMNTCNGENCDHDDIVYVGKICPLCEATRLVNVLREENERLQEECSKMDDQLSFCRDACEVCPNRIECVTTGRIK